MPQRLSTMFRDAVVALFQELTALKRRESSTATNCRKWKTRSGKGTEASVPWKKWYLTQSWTVNREELGSGHPMVWVTGLPWPFRVVWRKYLPLHCTHIQDTPMQPEQPKISRQAPKQMRQQENWVSDADWQKHGINKRCKWSSHMEDPTGWAESLNLARKHWGFCLGGTE